MATLLPPRRLAAALILSVLATACTSTGGEASTTTVAEQPNTTETLADDSTDTTDPGDSRTVTTPEGPNEPEPLSDVFTKLTEPGVGGRITSIAFDPIDPDRLFVGGDMLGIAVTNDFGDTWESTNGLASWEIGDITATPAADGRIWTGSLSGPQASADGITWELRRNGMPALSESAFTMPTEAVLIDPNNNSRLLAFNGNQRDWEAAGAYRDGEWQGDGSVWESADSGANWTQLSQIAAGGNIRAAAFSSDGATLYAAVARRGVYVSTDNGATWNLSGEGLPHGNPYDVTTHSSDPLTAWVSMGDGPEIDGSIVAGGIWKTIDGGATWTAANDGLSIVSNATAANTGSFHQIVVAPSNPDRLYTSNVAPGQAAIYRSDDGGDSWTIIADGSTRRPNAYEGALRAFDIGVHPTDADRIAIGSDDTLLGSVDGGTTWEDLTTREDVAGFFSGHGYSGLVSTDIIFNAAKPDEAILLGFDGGNFIQTTDGSLTWRRTIQDISAWGGGVEAAYSPSNPDRIYVLLGQFQNFRGIGITDDGGTTFRLAAGAGVGLPEVSNVDGGATGLAVLDQNNIDVVLAVVGRTLYRSDDGGESFAAVPGVTGARDVAVSPEGSVFLSTDSGTLVSTDGGLGFNDAGNPPVGITTLYTSQAEPGVVYGVAFRQGNGGMYRFDGSEWTQLFDDLYSHGVAIDPSNPNNLAVVTTEPAFNDISDGTGVYLSNDAGQTWTVVTSGLPMTRLRTAEFDPSRPDRLVVGTTGRGFYEISFLAALGG